MKRTHMRRTGALGVSLALVACVGCGGDHHGGSATDSAEPSARPTRTPIAGGFTATAGGTFPLGTATPTPPGGLTATPTGTLGTAVTATPSRSRTPARTFAPGAHGALRVGYGSGSPGATVAVNVELDVEEGVEIVGLQNDLRFDPTQIAVSSRAFRMPDCDVNSELAKEATVFSFQPPGCDPAADCTGVRALVLSFDNFDPIPSGSRLYTCNVAIAADAQLGMVNALPCSNAAASSPDGMQIDIECADGEIAVLIGDTPTPTPDLHGAVRIGRARGAPGATVLVDVTLDVDEGVEIAGTENDLLFDPSHIAVAATADGEPDCAVNPEIAKENTAFGFHPPGCGGDIPCTGVRAIVVSFDNVDPIPSGTPLYTCSVSIAPDVVPGTAYGLACVEGLASDANGIAVGIECIDGAIEVPGEVVPTLTPPPTPTCPPAPSPPTCAPDQGIFCTDPACGLGCFCVNPTVTPTPTAAVACPSATPLPEVECGADCAGSCVLFGRLGRCATTSGECFCDTEGPTPTPPQCP
jgi:hypothetical protein